MVEYIDCCAADMRESGGRDEHTIAEIHENSLRPYSYGAHLHQEPTESVITMEVRSHHNVTFLTDYHPYHLDSSATSSSALLPTYTNFFHTSCVDNHHLKHEPADTPRYMTSPESHYGHGEERYQSSATLAPPVAIPVNHDVFSTTTASESIHRDHHLESLRRELAYKCPRSSDLLMAITSTADAAVREHGSATSGVSSDDDEAPEELARPFLTPSVIPWKYETTIEFFLLY